MLKLTLIVIVLFAITKLIDFIKSIFSKDADNNNLVKPEKEEDIKEVDDIITQNTSKVNTLPNCVNEPNNNVNAQSPNNQESDTESDNNLHEIMKESNENFNDAMNTLHEILQSENSPKKFEIIMKNMTKQIKEEYSGMSKKEISSALIGKMNSLDERMSNMNLQELREYSNKSSESLKSLLSGINKIDITTCDKATILSLKCFDEDMANKFISERNNGKMWYDIDSFIEDFGIQQSEKNIIEDVLIFPQKTNTKFGRKIDL